VSELNQKLYVKIDEWLSRPITGEHAFVYLYGIWLKRSWGCEVRNVSVLVATPGGSAWTRTGIGKFWA